MSFVTNNTGSFFTGSAKVDAVVSALPAENKFTAVEANELHDAVLNLRDQFVSITELPFTVTSSLGIIGDSTVIIQSLVNEDIEINANSGSSQGEFVPLILNAKDISLVNRDVNDLDGYSVTLPASGTEIALAGLELERGGAFVQKPFGVYIQGVSGYIKAETTYVENDGFQDWTYDANKITLHENEGGEFSEQTLVISTAVDGGGGMTGISSSQGFNLKAANQIYIETPNGISINETIDTTTAPVTIYGSTITLVPQTSIQTYSTLAINAVANMIPYDNTVPAEGDLWADTAGKLRYRSGSTSWYIKTGSTP